MPSRELQGSEGESLKDVAVRIKSFVEEAIDPFKYTHHVVIVTHGGILAAIVNNAWNEGESSWINMGQLQVPPTGTVVLINPCDPKKGSVSYIGSTKEQCGFSPECEHTYLQGYDTINDYDYINNFPIHNTRSA